MRIRYIYWELSNYCNLRCKQCFANATKDANTIVKKDILFKAIDRLTYNQDVAIRFGGGEPLLVPYLFELIQYCAQKKIKVDITSNGLLLNELIVNKLIDSGLRELTISLDGLKETNDYFRGKGCYDKVDNILSKIVNIGQLTLSLGFTVTKVNYQQIDDFVKMYISKGLKKFYFFRYCGNKNRDLCALDDRQLQEAALTIRNLEKKYPGVQFIHESLSFYSFIHKDSTCSEGCNFIRGIVSINYLGDIVVCAAINKSLGNIFRDEIQYLYRNITYEQKLLKKIPESCIDCKYEKVCHGGCKGESYRLFNNYSNKDPLCCISLKPRINDS